jgi:hypothetical protein
MHAAERKSWRRYQIFAVYSFHTNQFKSDIGGMASFRRLERMTASHMWTAASSQGYFGQCSDQIACVHMSGLFSRSHMNAGQDGFRDASSKHPSDLWRPVESTECLASWIDRSHHLLVALQVLASAQHGCS